MASIHLIVEANHCARYPELVMRFAIWADRLCAVPTAEQIRDRFEVSHATAYRWRIDWCAAKGLPLPEPKSGFPKCPAKPSANTPT